VIESGTLCIICAAQEKGKVHDFTLFKMTIAEIICWGVFLLADSGYQGIQEYHENSEIPIKKPRGGELTADEKSHNRELSRRRVPIEWVNARIKTFKMMSVPFRTRAKRCRSMRCCCKQDEDASRQVLCSLCAVLYGCCRVSFSCVSQTDAVRQETDGTLDAHFGDTKVKKTRH
jgi:hypothetical protein